MGLAPSLHSISAPSTRDIGSCAATNASHAARTLVASEADLFYLPLWDYTSVVLGECNGTTHSSRMWSARRALAASPHFKRYNGADHVWGSSKSQVLRGETNGWADNATAGQNLALVDRLRPLSGLLARSIVGRYKAFGPHHRSGVGSCTFELPYLANRRASSHALPSTCVDPSVALANRFVLTPSAPLNSVAVRAGKQRAATATTAAAAAPGCCRGVAPR